MFCIYFLICCLYKHTHQVMHNIHKISPKLSASYTYFCHLIYHGVLYKWLYTVMHCFNGCIRLYFMDIPSINNSYWWTLVSNILLLQQIFVIQHCITLWLHPFTFVSVFLETYLRISIPGSKISNFEIHYIFPSKIIVPYYT